MKNINISIALIVFLFFSGNIYAQYSIKKNEFRKNDLTSKNIFYEIKTLTPKQISKLKKRDLLNAVKDRYNRENKLLFKLIQSNPSSNNAYKELSTEKIKKKIKNKEEVWYVTLNKHTDKFFDRRVHKKRFYYYYSHYKLSLFKNKKEILSIPLVDEELSELNLGFAFDELRNIASKSASFKNQRTYAKDVNSRSNSLKGKTLLISENLTGFSKEYLKKFFNGSIEIVSEQEIVKAVKEKDEQKAYLLITINDISNEPSFNHIIIDCSNNEPVLIYRNSTAYLKPCKHSCITHQHKNKLEFLFGLHFKRYQKIIKSQNTDML